MRVNGKSRRDSRLDHATETDGKTGRLSPDWVEWLMGWPDGWTSLRPLAPEAFGQWRGSTSWFDHDPADDGKTPRVALGVEARAARIRALGNGQVPRVVAAAWEALT